MRTHMGVAEINTHETCSTVLNNDSVLFPHRWPSKQYSKFFPCLISLSLVFKKPLLDGIAKLLSWMVPSVAALEDICVRER